MVEARGVCGEGYVYFCIAYMIVGAGERSL